MQNYRDDDHAVLPSGRSHVSGYIDNDRNAVDPILLESFPWEKLRAVRKDKKLELEKETDNVLTRRVSDSDFLRDYVITYDKALSYSRIRLRVSRAGFLGQW
jgi:hypothetical protein